MKKRAGSKKKTLRVLTHMSEIDDRDLALAEKSLASLRNHRRAGAAAHSDNCRSLVFSEINRSLSNTVSDALSFSLCQRRSRINSLSTFSLFFFYRRLRDRQQRNKPLLRARSTRPPGIGARYRRLTGISKRSYYHCTHDHPTRTMGQNVSVFSITRESENRENMVIRLTVAVRYEFIARMTIR